MHGMKALLRFSVPEQLEVHRYYSFSSPIPSPLKAMRGTLETVCQQGELRHTPGEDGNFKTSPTSLAVTIDESIDEPIEEPTGQNNNAYNISTESTP